MCTVLHILTRVFCLFACVCFELRLISFFHMGFLNFHRLYLGSCSSHRRVSFIFPPLVSFEISVPFFFVLKCIVCFRTRIIITRLIAFFYKCGFKYFIFTYFWIAWNTLGKMKTKRKLNQRQDNVKGLMIDDSFSFFTTDRDYMGKRWPDNDADFLELLSLNFFVSY